MAGDVNEQTSLITQKRSIKKVIEETLKTGLPFGISAAAAGNTALMSLLLAELGPDAVAAGPFITALQNFAIGICRASLLSNSLMIGPVNGSANYKLAEGNNQDAEADFKRVGAILRQGWMFATLLAGASTLLLAFSGDILKSVGIEAEIAEHAQTYFRWYSIGVWPLLHSFTDQQLAVGTKNAWFPTLRGPVYGGLVYGLSLLAMRGHFGPAFTGMKAIGFGSALAAWATFALTKLAHLMPSFRQYHLYSYDSDGKWETLKNMMSLGTKLGFQVATEWANLLGLSLIIGRMGLSDVRAMQPSIQLMTFSGLYSLGFSAGVGANCANALGEVRSSQPGDLNINDVNLIRRGHIGISVGMVVPLVLAAAILLSPQTFTSSLLPATASQATLTFSNQVLRANAIRIIVDSFRINAAGPLRAFKDINFVTWSSFISMTLIGLTVGALMSFMGGQNLVDFSWVQDAFILVPAFLIMMRWLQYSAVTPQEKLGLAKLHMDEGGALKTIFKPLTALGSKSEDYGVPEALTSRV